MAWDDFPVVVVGRLLSAIGSRHSSTVHFITGPYSLELLLTEAGVGIVFVDRTGLRPLASEVVSVDDRFVGNLVLVAHQLIAWCDSNHAENADVAELRRATEVVGRRARDENLNDL